MTQNVVASRYIVCMENKFALKISYPDCTSEIVTIDLNGSISEQMRPVAEKRAQVRYAHMGFYVGEKNTFNEMHMRLIARELDSDKSKNLEVCTMLDLYEEERIDAHLILPNVERKILEEFYHAMGGDDWLNNTNWLSDRPLNEWFGIRTNDEGRVCDVWLSFNDLDGEMPASLFDLECLTHLDLCSNYLTGAMPREIGRYVMLQDLNLSGNELSGSIPREIGQCRQLRTINISHNCLSGAIPEEIWLLTNLCNLDLEHNALSSPIPDAVVNCIRLSELNLNDNPIGGVVPESICRLKYLGWLGLRNCGIIGKLPDCFCENIPEPYVKLYDSDSLSDYGRWQEDGHYCDHCHYSNFTHRRVS